MSYDLRPPTCTDRGLQHSQCPMTLSARVHRLRATHTRQLCHARRADVSAQSSAPCPGISESQAEQPHTELLLHRRRQLLAAAGAQFALWPLQQQPSRAEGSVIAEGPGEGIRPKGKSASEPGTSGKVKQVRMRTLQDSALSVAIYPEFEYNALGGGGVAEARAAGSSNRYDITFDTNELNIPDVTAKTAKWLGVPMLPGAKIQVTPKKFEGFIDRDTGEVQMQFVAEFNFSAYNAYKAPPLFVTTNLTTEQVKGSIRSGHGKRMNENGIARLVGVATVPTTTDLFINKFLMLPTETFAVMSSEFTFL